MCKCVGYLCLQNCWLIAALHVSEEARDGGWAGHGAGGRGPGEYVRVIGDQRPVFIYLSATVYKSKLMLINVLH